MEPALAILTPLQQAFLRQWGKSEMREVFFLTGGTALSAFYLQHRYSEDLDFFTELPEQVPQVVPLLRQIEVELDCTLTIRRQFRSFLEVVIQDKSATTIRCDFAQDSPVRLQPLVHNDTYKILVDNALDIACNKLSALFDRTETKDFVDIYFIDQELIPFNQLLLEAKKKHLGLDDYWLAISFLKVDELGPLPRMVKPLAKEQLTDFFREKAKLLMR